MGEEAREGLPTPAVTKVTRLQGNAVKIVFRSPTMTAVRNRYPKDG